MCYRARALSSIELNPVTFQAVHELMALHGSIKLALVPYNYKQMPLTVQTEMDALF